MTLAFNSDHTLYYPMDTIRSVGLAWTYFTHPDYLVVLCWVCVTYLSLDTIDPIGSQTYCYAKFFMGRMGYTPLGTPIIASWL